MGFFVFGTLSCRSGHRFSCHVISPQRTALKTVGRLCQTPTILAQTRQSVFGSADPCAVEFRKFLNESSEPRVEVSCTHEVVHLAHVRFEFIQELKKIFFGVNLFGLPTEVS